MCELSIITYNTMNNICIPNLTSLRRLFSNSFQNLAYVLGGGGIPVGSVSIYRGADLSGGGYLVFGSRGADSVWQLPWWSVYAEVEVPVAGSQRAIVACAHPVLGLRFELGLSSTNTLYCTGTTTVESDSIVSTGRHQLRWVYTGDSAGGNRFKGDILTAAVYPFELSDFQVREWGRRSRQLRTV